MSELPPLDFHSLRLRGLEWAQTYAGEVWTDYNIHDPGVTLLEALAYGLTDLAYRVDFETADLLTGPGNSLDLAALGLLPPEEALPSRPATLEDWRAVILDVDPAIDNAWVDAQPDDAGRLRVGLQAHGLTDQAARAALLARVWGAAQANRNAGEDVVAVGFVREIPCGLELAAEVERDREPAEIAADVLDRCDALLTAGVRAVPFEELRNEGQTLDRVFLGPLGDCGLFDRDQLRRSAGGARPADMLTGEADAPERFFRAVGEIADVRFVQHLRLVPQVKTPLRPDETAVLVLQPPADRAAADRLVLESRGRRLPLDPERLRYHIGRLALERADRMRPHQQVDAVVTRPKGRYRAVDAYTPVQYHLPRAYHVTAHGLGPSATEAERARARQLRGFLLQFEQHLADFLAQLDALPVVFAARDGLAGYRASPAPGAGLPAEDRDLYPMTAGMDGIGQAFEDRLERRGRALDYLLALYGESFSQNSLRTFDLYRIGLERDEAVIANRERFLAQVAGLTRDRGGGADLRLPEDPGGLCRRLALLLDMRPGSEAPKLTAALGDKGSDFYWDPPAGRRRLGRIARDRLPLPDPPEAGVVMLTEAGAGQGVSGLIDALRSHGLLTPGPIHPSLVAHGCQLDRFALRQDRDGWWLLLDDAAAEDWLVVSLFSDRAAAERVANLVRRLAVVLCQAAEGVFLIENVLLRPRGQGEAAGALAARQAPLGLVAVFAGWTARTRQPGLRTLAAETVRMNAAAHLTLDCRWLDRFEDLLAFEDAHTAWRAALAAHLAAPNEDGLADAVDRAALKLADAMDRAQSVRF